jgi:hypothetical protein
VGDKAKPIFLDTNVVQALATYGEYIFEGNLLPDNERQLQSRGERYRSDIESLAQLVPLLQTAGARIAISPITLLEHQDSYRLDLDLELFNGFLANASPPELRLLNVKSAEKKLVDSPSGVGANKLDFLPDANDRAIVDDALAFGCEWLITLDYRTIWVHRSRLALLGLRVLTPSEALRTWLE